MMRSLPALCGCANFGVVVFQFRTRSQPGCLQSSESLYRICTLGGVTHRTYGTHGTKEFAESRDLSRFEELQSVRVLPRSPSTRPVPTKDGTTVFGDGTRSGLRLCLWPVGQGESNGRHRTKDRKLAEDIASAKGCEAQIKRWSRGKREALISSDIKA